MKKIVLFPSLRSVRTVSRSLSLESRLLLSDAGWARGYRRRRDHARVNRCTGRLQAGRRRYDFQTVQRLYVQQLTRQYYRLLLPTLLLRRLLLAEHHSATLAYPDTDALVAASQDYRLAGQLSGDHSYCLSALRLLLMRRYDYFRLAGLRLCLGNDLKKIIVTLYKRFGDKILLKH